jgi:hypothetical protein
MMNNVNGKNSINKERVKFDNECARLREELKGFMEFSR